MKNNKRRWLWFRGLIRWHVHWGEFLQEFKKAFPNDEILMIDFPGFGNFHHLTCPREMSKMVEHVRQQIQIDQGPFHILAFSLGGMVASQFSAQYPHLVTQQFLINTSDRKSPFFLRFRPGQWSLLFFNFLNPQAERVEREILQTISNDPLVRERHYENFVEAYLKTPVSRTNLLNQLHLASQTEFPPSPSVPSVILASQGDRLVHYSCSEKIAKSWGLNVHLHSDAGHDLSLDAPHWVIEKVQSSLI